jgi:hypothetical protein
LGNGPGLKDFASYGSNESVSLEGGVLTEEMLEDAVAKSLANFGRPSFNPIIMSSMNMKGMGWSHNPEFTGTSWEDHYRISKRERKFAQLHVFLWKLKVLPNEGNNEIHETAVKRLKRAKWARYQKPKKV